MALVVDIMNGYYLSNKVHVEHQLKELSNAIVARVYDLYMEEKYPTLHCPIQTHCIKL